MQQEYTPIGCEHKLPNGLSAWQFQSEMRSNINGGSLVAIHVCGQCGDIRIVGYRTSEDGKHVDRFNETFDLHHASAIDAIIKAANFFNEEIKWGRIEPGGQSAGTWVKASEMNHEEFIAYYARLDHDTEAEIKSSGYFKDDFFFFHMHNLKINKDQFSVLEILDESQSLDNKDREEQAEWEFVQILKENYEAAKRSDEYHFAGKTKKEAVVETYEDLFEIIKGLPLKRQKVDFSFANNKEEKSEPYYGMTCPHCGAQTNVDPALVKEDDPMPYCPECDEPLFDDKNETT